MMPNLLLAVLLFCVFSNLSDRDGIWLVGKFFFFFYAVAISERI
jgi:hypothetical protein